MVAVADGVGGDRGSCEVAAADDDDESSPRSWLLPASAIALW